MIFQWAVVTSSAAKPDLGRIPAFFLMHHFSFHE